MITNVVVIPAEAGIQEITVRQLHRHRFRRGEQVSQFVGGTAPAAHC
jgi:hypothetical protein